MAYSNNIRFESIDMEIQMENQADRRVLEGYPCDKAAVIGWWDSPYDYELLSTTFDRLTD